MLSLRARLRILFMVFALIIASGIAASEPKIYFEENFRNYRDTCPLCTPNIGIEIGNDPVWNQTAEANCRLKESGLIFNDFVPNIKAAPELKNFDVLFKFRFLSDGEKKFQLRLRQDANEKPGEIIVEFSATSLRLTSENTWPAITAEAKLPADIPNNEWHTCAATAKDGKLTLYLDQQRAFQKVLEAQISQAPRTSINFYGFKNLHFSISDIIVREPAPLPDNSVARLLPAFIKEDVSVYKSGVVQKNVAVPANDIFGATFRTGLDKNAVELNVNWADGKTNTISFSSAGFSTERKVRKDGKDSNEKVLLSDAIIEVRGISGPKSQLNYYIRPLLRRYHTSYSFTDMYHDILRDWDQLPKASEYPVKFECRQTTAGLDLYLNGRFAGNLPGGVAKELAFALSPSASLKDAFSTKATFASEKFLPLDVGALHKAKTFAGANSSINTGINDIKGVPIFVTSGDGSADIGLCHEGQGNWALEVDEYLARSPFDGFLTEVHFTVPSAPYSKAWVLCAVDLDPSKDPVLTTRLAHYIESGVGNNTLADTHLTLPRGNAKLPEFAKQVGTVTRKSVDGKTQEIPLLLVEVPLNTGQIIDLVASKPRLNFEFFGKPAENLEQLDNTSKPDPHSTSAVQIFGVTLEKSPIMLDFIQSQPANIFHNDEKPETTAVLRSLAPGKGKLAWDIFDVDGKNLGGSDADYNFTNAGEETKINIPLSQPQPGWYELRVSLLNESGKTLLAHPARFALLGKDERKAGHESPYGIWWFDGVHGTPTSAEFGGSVLFKAGIRQVSWTSRKEKELEKWMLTKDQVNMPFRFDDLKNPDVAIKNAETTIKKHLEEYPHTREVLIFHESGPGNEVPLELIGIKPTLSNERIAREKRYADLLNLAGKFFREKFPQLKLVVGNNSCAQATIAAALRQGGKPEYIDYIGIEASAQVFVPEKLQEWSIQGLNIAKDTAKTLSGRDIPATACYEFTYRSERDMGEQQHAEWYARDLLIGLANDFSRIGPGILFDCSNAYYNGLWGGSGIMQRGPYGYPKKAYVAFATLTNVLDRVKFRRQITTGSQTVYALEFDRADKKFAAALWASRGEAEFIVEYAGDTTLRVTDMYGRSRELKTSSGKISIAGGSAPTYILCDKEIKSITLGKRSFAKDEARAGHATVVASLEKADSVQLDSQNNTLDTPKVFPLQLPIRQLGEFDLRQTKDDQRDDCIELELKTDKNKEINKYITEYTTLRLKEPLAIVGEPAALGVWVKGNSNWGRILFEIEDGEGETWQSVGTGGWGCDILDWPGNAALNFDGWNFVSLPLRDTRLFNDHSPGPVMEQWVSSGGNKKIDYPIKVKALIVEMNRTALDLIDFKPVRSAIRLKNISGISEPAN